MTARFRSFVIFCDGACSGNPGPGGWGAIIASPDGQVRELGGREAHTTNNKMELTAAIRALDSIRGRPNPVQVHTDSSYVIRGMTEWIEGWKRRGWRSMEGKPVKNRTEWEELELRVNERALLGKVSWHYSKGHSGIPGNERADEIAVAFSGRSRPTLYDGPLIRYGIAIYDLPDSDGSVPKTRRVKPTSKSAFSYLSLVDGIPWRHENWIQCERRVKGKSGAKFKKAMSEADEKKILSDWGVDPKNLKS